jgi:DNA-binding CsgD family transcriptional regulator
VDTVSAQAFAVFDEYQTAIPRDAVAVFLARSLLDRGRWDDALTSAALSGRTRHGERPLARMVEGVVRARRGEEGADALIEQAWSELEAVPDGSRHGMIRVALAEAAWLRGDHGAALGYALAARSAPHGWQFARSAGDLAVWANRCGRELVPPTSAALPVQCEFAGDWRGAVRGWQELNAPYEAALAALPGDERAAREALVSLHRLGADAAARAFARERSARATHAPRRLRHSTLAHPAGLTRREQEVLRHLATGATNARIAGSLHLSERTVAHHVSAILGKLGAPTRMAAVEQARNAGLLAEDGPPRERT